jgi:hypothetical protein
MATFVAGVWIAFAISCAVLLFVLMIRAIRVGPPSFAKMTALALLVSVAVWQAYLLIPIVGRYLAYFLMPIAVGGVLFAFLWNLRDALKGSPSDGPDVKIPAVAKRLREEMEISEDREVHQKIA